MSSFEGWLMHAWASVPLPKGTPAPRRECKLTKFSILLLPDKKMQQLRVPNFICSTCQRYFRRSQDIATHKRQTTCPRQKGIIGVTQAWT